MSQRLRQRIEQSIRKGEKLLSLFVTAGFPDPEMTVDIILACDKAGVDFIELGMPFSDPIADGPVIQKASDIALQKGMTINRILNMVKTVRQQTSIPIILMGYVNPVFQTGFESFFTRCAEAGVDGLILPDWPPEESTRFTDLLNQYDLDLIHLIAPNTPLERIKQIDRHSKAFVYCTAYTGVTGKDSHTSNEMETFLSTLKRHLKNPFLVGFGIKSAEDFNYYSGFSAGCIVGSAFIKTIENIRQQEIDEKVKEFVHRIRYGMETVDI